MTISIKHISICCLCLLASPAYAQLFSGSGWGFNIAVISALGNRFQRLGIALQGYYCRDFAQVNAEVRAYRNFRNLGPSRRYNELVTSAGFVVGYGAKRSERNEFPGIASNQTRYATSLGYAYNLYFNKIRTIQQTGTISFGFGDVTVIAENDIFARPTLDRFRTGAFLVQYQLNNQYQFAINCTMWTGQMGNKVTADSSFPFIGYMDTAHGVYTNCSHGLLSGQFKVALNSGQTVQANAGIDAEQVRNFVQNRLIHDMVFIPRRWYKPKNCHIPMLDTNGNQYLYKPDQKIKRPQPYWNVFTGAGVFY